MTNPTTIELPEFAFGVVRRASQQRHQLERLPDSEFTAPHLGRVRLAGRWAELRIDQRDELRLAIPVESPQDLRIALTRNHELPFNLRFACEAQEWRLRADLAVPDSAGPRAAFELIEASLSHANPRDDNASETHPPIAKNDVDQALEPLRGSDDGPVDLETGWELRPRVSGQALPVRAWIDGRRLRLERSVQGLATLVDLDEPTLDAVAHQALRFNAQIIHARLAVHGERIVVETCLDVSQLTTLHVKVAVRAVAVVEHQAQESLVILAKNKEIAEHYGRLLGAI